MFRCTNCNRLLFFRIIDILDIFKGYSGLGPSVICCSKCGAVINTSNIEWVNMSLKTKFYLWFITIVYSLVLGLLLSVVFLTLFAQLMNLDETSFVSGTKMLIASTSIASVFIILQSIRIIFSVFRTNRNTNEPYRTSLFNLHTNFQGFGFACIIIAIVLSLLIYIGIL